MVYLFERGAESLRLETLYDKATGEYVLITRLPNRSQQTERFTNAAAFQARLAAIEAGLHGERWAQVGPPVPLVEGWRV